mmetsp:Transcript_116154/g.323507  ORF Transcript_116154/g.323507 Transcript_116154/m.323507 type:complete len:385 (-) Transcript_116154:705-1859(-)
MSITPKGVPRVPARFTWNRASFGADRRAERAQLAICSRQAGSGCSTRRRSARSLRCGWASHVPFRPSAGRAAGSRGRGLPIGVRGCARSRYRGHGLLSSWAGHAAIGTSKQPDAPAVRTPVTWPRELCGRPCQGAQAAQRSWPRPPVQSGWATCLPDRRRRRHPSRGMPAARDLLVWPSPRPARLHPGQQQHSCLCLWSRVRLRWPPDLPSPGTPAAPEPLTRPLARLARPKCCSPGRRRLGCLCLGRLACWVAWTKPVRGCRCPCVGTPCCRTRWARRSTSACRSPHACTGSAPAGPGLLTGRRRRRKRQRPCPCIFCCRTRGASRSTLACRSPLACTGTGSRCLWTGWPWHCHASSDAALLPPGRPRPAAVPLPRRPCHADP